MIKASVNKKPAPIENDTKGGSIGYNRLDMQVSQALHMAIELYPNLNYLLIMDHYDDITLFDDEAAPKVVSYYQMKTSEDTISIDTAISEKWLSKLYSHLSNVQLNMLPQIILATIDYSNFQTGIDVPTNIITLTERKKLLLEQDYIEHEKEISTWFELLKK